MGKNYMMPIYFPFTYVADRVADALAACFGSFAVYQPVSEALSVQMQVWKERGIMAVRVPVTANENELKRAVKRYRIWADLHGQDLSGMTGKLKARMDSMSLLSNFSSSQIVAEIKDNIYDTAYSRTPDPVMAARIFLYLAQEFDRQNHELAQELARYDQEQAELIRRLKIEDDPFASEFVDPPFQFSGAMDDYLIADRLESWTRIFLQDSETSGLLITHSPAVLAYLLDRVSNAVQVMQTEFLTPELATNEELAEWRKRTVSRVNRFIEQKKAGSVVEPIELAETAVAENNNTLTVYQVPDHPPRDLLTRCTRIESSAADQTNFRGEIKNTLVALIRI